MCHYELIFTSDFLRLRLSKTNVWKVHRKNNHWFLDLKLTHYTRVSKNSRLISLLNTFSHRFSLNTPFDITETDNNAFQLILKNISTIRPQQQASSSNLFDRPTLSSAPPSQSIQTNKPHLSSSLSSAPSAWLSSSPPSVSVAGSKISKSGISGEQLSPSAVKPCQTRP